MKWRAEHLQTFCQNFRTQPNSAQPSKLHFTTRGLWKHVQHGCFFLSLFPPGGLLIQDTYFLWLDQNASGLSLGEGTNFSHAEPRNKGPSRDMPNQHLNCRHPTHDPQQNKRSFHEALSSMAFRSQRLPTHGFALLCMDVHICE